MSTSTAAIPTTVPDTGLPAWFSTALNVPVDEGVVDVEGCDIHFLAWGKRGAPGLLMTHGMMAHARCWAFIAPLLADHYRVVSYDISGMGDSGWREDYNFEQRGREAAAVAAATGLTDAGRRPVFICHSFGGSVGMAAVDDAPSAWAGLILVDMAMVMPGQHDQFEERRKHRGSRMGTDGPRPHRVYPDLATALGRFRLAPDQPCDNDYLFDYVARHSLKAVEGGWVWKFDPRILGGMDRSDPTWWSGIAARFANLATPRGVIYGAQSELFSAALAEHLQSLSPSPLPIVAIPDAHHHVMLDQPIALAATLDAMAQSLLMASQRE